MTLGLGGVLHPLSNSWIIIIIWLYIALNRTANIDCYLGGGSTQGLGLIIAMTAGAKWVFEKSLYAILLGEVVATKKIEDFLDIVYNKNYMCVYIYIYRMIRYEI